MLTYADVCYDTAGRQVIICGSVEELGGWKPAQGVRLATNKELYPEWIAKIELPIRRCMCQFLFFCTIKASKLST